MFLQVIYFYNLAVDVAEKILIVKLLLNLDGYEVPEVQ
jgi:hypothetical protein